jgi:hypothetical protein
MSLSKKNATTGSVVKFMINIVRKNFVRLREPIVTCLSEGLACHRQARTM